MMFRLKYLVVLLVGFEMVSGASIFTFSGAYLDIVNITYVNMGYYMDNINFNFKITAVTTVDKLNSVFVDYLNILATRSFVDIPRSVPLKNLLLSLYATTDSMKTAFDNFIDNTKITPVFESNSVGLLNALKKVDKIVKTKISSSFDVCYTNWQIQSRVFSTISQEFALIQNCTLTQRLYAIEFFKTANNILSSFESTYNKLLLSPIIGCTQKNTTDLLNCTLAIANNGNIQTVNDQAVKDITNHLGSYSSKAYQACIRIETDKLVSLISQTANGLSLCL